MPKIPLLGSFIVMNLKKPQSRKLSTCQSKIKYTLNGTLFYATDGTPLFHICQKKLLILRHSFYLQHCLFHRGRSSILAQRGRGLKFDLRWCLRRSSSDFYEAAISTWTLEGRVQLYILVRRPRHQSGFFGGH